VINSHLEIEDRRFSLDLFKTGKYIRKIQPEKTIRQVILYQPSEFEGFYKKVKVSNRPLKLELKPGLNGAIIFEIQGEEPVKAAITSRQDGIYNYLTIWVDEGYVKKMDKDLISQTLEFALRLYVGGKTGADIGNYGLTREVGK